MSFIIYSFISNSIVKNRNSEKAGKMNSRLYSLDQIEEVFNLNTGLTLHMQNRNNIKIHQQLFKGMQKHVKACKDEF